MQLSVLLALALVSLFFQKEAAAKNQTGFHQKPYLMLTVPQWLEWLVWLVRVPQWLVWLVWLGLWLVLSPMWKLVQPQPSYFYPVLLRQSFDGGLPMPQLFDFLEILLGRKSWNGRQICSASMLSLSRSKS